MKTIVALSALVLALALAAPAPPALAAPKSKGPPSGKVARVLPVCQRVSGGTRHPISKDHRQIVSGAVHEVAGHDPG